MEVKKSKWALIRNNNGEWISDIHAVIFEKEIIDIKDIKESIQKNELPCNISFDEYYDEKSDEYCMWLYHSNEGLWFFEDLETLAKKYDMPLSKNYCFTYGELHLWCYKNEVNDLINREEFEAVAFPF